MVLVTGLASVCSEAAPPCCARAHSAYQMHHYTTTHPWFLGEEGGNAITVHAQYHDGTQHAHHCSGAGHYSAFFGHSANAEVSPKNRDDKRIF